MGSNLLSLAESLSKYTRAHFYAKLNNKTDRPKVELDIPPSLLLQCETLASDLVQAYRNPCELPTYLTVCILKLF